MKTVTVKGKVYQINQPYRNVSNGLIGYLCEDAFTAGERFMLSILPNYKKERGGELMFAVQIEPFTAGTIEGAPIELEKGEWYIAISASLFGVITMTGVAGQHTILRRFIKWAR